MEESKERPRKKDDALHRIKDRIRRDTEELQCLESLKDCSFFLSLENSAIPLRVTLGKRIAQHNGKLALTLNLETLPNDVVVVLSDTDLKRSTKNFASNPSSAIKDKRIRQLLGQNRPFDTSPGNDVASSFLSRFGRALEAGSVKFIRVHDMARLLDFFDSAVPAWHLTRGLPGSYGSATDLIVMTAAHRGAKGYLQEYHVFGTDERGMAKTHRLCLDVPMGTTVILTQEQYSQAINRKDELNKKYYERLQRLMHNKDKMLKPAAPKNVFYCSICKEAYKNYSEHEQTVKHISMVQKSEPVYKEIEAIFAELERKHRPRTEPFLAFGCSCGNNNEFSQSCSNHSTQDSVWSRSQCGQTRNEEFVAKFSISLGAQQPKENVNLPISITLPPAKRSPAKRPRKKRSDSAESSTPPKTKPKKRSSRQVSLTPPKNSYSGSTGRMAQKKRGRPAKRGLEEIEAEFPSGKKAKPEEEPETLRGGNKTLEQFGIFACKLN